MERPKSEYMMLINMKKGLYIAYRENGHYRSENVEEAFIFRTEKGEQFLSHTIPEKERSEWTLLPVPESGITRFRQSDFDWSEIEEKLRYFYLEAALIVISQKSNLKTAEQKIIDMAHYLEFNKIGVVQSYRAMQQLRQLLLERRRCKDDIIIGETFLEADPKAVVEGALRAKLEAMKDRKYRPRALPELFGEPTDAGTDAKPE